MYEELKRNKKRFTLIIVGIVLLMLFELAIAGFDICFMITKILNKENFVMWMLLSLWMIVLFIKAIFMLRDAIKDYHRSNKWIMDIFKDEVSDRYQMMKKINIIYILDLLAILIIGALIIVDISSLIKYIIDRQSTEIIVCSITIAVLILAIILDIITLWHNVKTDKENKNEEEKQ